MTAPKYPHVKVKLSGRDGNAMMIIGRVNAKLREAGVPKDEVDAFTKEATSGDYDHLLQTVMKTVSAT